MMLGLRLTMKFPVVAYNNYHYENLHPVNEQDMQETKRLVNSYINGKYELDYGLRKENKKSLILPNVKNISQDRRTSYQVLAKSTIGKTREGIPNLETKDQQRKRQQEKQLIEVPSKKNQKQNVDIHQHMDIDKLRLDKQDTNDLGKMNQSDLEKEKESFKWGNIKFEETQNEKIRCGLCETECLRLVTHLNGSPGCSKNINMLEFKIDYNKYKAKCRLKKHIEKRKALDPESFKEETNKRKKKSEQKKKAKDPDDFKENRNNRTRKSEQIKKAEDPEKFKESRNNRKKKSEKKAKQKILISSKKAEIIG